MEQVRGVGMSIGIAESWNYRFSYLAVSLTFGAKGYGSAETEPAALIEIVSVGNYPSISGISHLIQVPAFVQCSSNVMVGTIAKAIGIPLPRSYVPSESFCSEYREP